MDDVIVESSHTSIVCVFRKITLILILKYIKITYPESKLHNLHIKYVVICWQNCLSSIEFYVLTLSNYGQQIINIIRNINQLQSRAVLCHLMKNQLEQLECAKAALLCLSFLTFAYFCLPSLTFCLPMLAYLWLTFA